MRLGSGFIIALILTAGQAAAGAWPRGDGKSFVALSSQFSTPQEDPLYAGLGVDTRASIYGEHGLTDDLTLGFDAAYAMGDDAETVAALVFLRRTVWQSTGGHVVAAELGLGARSDVALMAAVAEPQGTALRIRPGLAWGKGFESAWGQGWMGVESYVELTSPSDGALLKLDATVGIKPWEDWMFIFSVQSSKDTGGDAIIRLAPSVAYRLSERSHLQLGLTAGVSGDNAVGIKLSNWWSF